MDEDTLRPKLLKEIGGKYVDGRKVKVADIDEVCGAADFVFEATGIAKLQIQLIDTLSINGIYVATGISGGARPLTIMAGNLMQQLVLKNQVMVGSVNASLNHYKMAVEDIKASYEKWPEAMQQVITEKIAYTNFKAALHSHLVNEIKVVVDWT